MMRAAKPSLLRRLVINQLLVIVGFALLAMANLTWVFYRDGDGDLDHFLLQQARVMVERLEPLRGHPDQFAHDAALMAVLTRNSFALQKTKKPYGESSFDLAIRVRDASGRVLFVSPSKTPVPWEKSRQEALAAKSGERAWRLNAVNSKDGALSLQLAETAEAADEDFVDIVLRFMVTPLLVFLPFAGLMTWWASHRGLSPMRELAALISRRSPNDLKALAPLTVYAETSPLVNEINSLLAKLRATLARERDFLADAAHELRTPLAVIQAQLHVLQHAGNDTERGASVDELNQGIARAAGLIQKLLLTARVSSEEFVPRMEVVDLTAFTQERLAQLSTLAARKNIEMELRAPPRVQVRLDRETFVSAVDNVIENAIRYTPAGGHVWVEIDRLGASQVRLRVTDDGMGIPPEMHERVFERFFRVNAGDTQGSGLGLAIVKRVLSLHGGQVSLSAGANSRGLAVSLTVPQGV
jgi:two-component system, OmpR family, sensor histidine kinase QseC